jgi:hypothetical protein
MAGIPGTASGPGVQTVLMLLATGAMQRPGLAQRISAKMPTTPVIITQSYEVGLTTIPGRTPDRVLGFNEWNE